MHCICALEVPARVHIYVHLTKMVTKLCERRVDLFESLKTGNLLKWIRTPAQMINNIKC